MRSFRRIARFRDRRLATFFDEAAREHGHTNLFNPSFMTVGGALVAAYRAIPPDDNRIRAYLAVRSAPEAATRVVDLSAHGAAHGIERVADPKVVRLGEELFVTVNTGFVPKGRFNDIWLIRVFPTLGAPQRVAPDFERQGVEKNWAFFTTGSGALAAVYRLHPYTEAVCVSGQPGAEVDLGFALRTPTRADSSAAEDLTIGTQLVADAGEHRMIAHEKQYREGKRRYFGRAVSITGLGTDDVAVRVSSRRLIHTLRDARRREGVHNPNLLSATYFSGLATDGADALLGYGVNDVSYSAARMRGDKLWP